MDVDTTCGAVPRIPPAHIPGNDLAQVLKIQSENLQLLRDEGVTLAIGGDTVSDSSVAEVEYLQKLGVFDNVTLLRMWTETTPQTILPGRRIGRLDDGYEASFIALEGSTVDDLQNVRKIKLRFKQGNLLSMAVRPP